MYTPLLQNNGRWACDAIGTLTKLGTDARGRHDFQFTGYLKIDPDLYSWTLDNFGFKNLGIAFMGVAVKAATGKKTPAPVYTTPNPKDSGLPTIYMRHFYFDYKKKGVKLSLIGI
ncbi:hypothetical protein [Acinetobacter faecalis]|uniref:hypothetical protein n=1 Tax=Acinetobacter faecalis TaxID=2665161 RepID=UPI002A9156C2|nr:hypothetical protein [Acinetobacter faecalis]MDY6457672.1 hypothetical protein [Acinetobacter faecalis]